MQFTPLDRWLLKKYVYVTEVFCGTLPSSVPDGVHVEKSDGKGQYMYRMTARDPAVVDLLIESLRLENIMFASRVANLDTAWARLLSNPRRSPTWTVLGIALAFFGSILFLTGLPQRGFNALIASSDKAAEERFDRERNPEKYKDEKKEEGPSILGKIVGATVQAESSLVSIVGELKSQVSGIKGTPPPAQEAVGPPAAAPAPPAAPAAAGGHAAPPPVLGEIISGVGHNAEAAKKFQDLALSGGDSSPEEEGEEGEADSEGEEDILASAEDGASGTTSGKRGSKSGGRKKAGASGKGGTAGAPGSKGAGIDDSSDGALETVGNDGSGLEDQPESGSQGSLGGVAGATGTGTAGVIGAGGQPMEDEPGASGLGVDDSEDNAVTIHPGTGEPGGDTSLKEGATPDGKTDSIPPPASVVLRRGLEKQIFATKKEKAPALNIDIFFDHRTLGVADDSHSEPQLLELAQLLSSYPWTLFAWRIEVYADRKGSADYNKALSQRRADALIERLVRDYGINSERVIAVGMGESQEGPDDVSNPLLRRMKVIRQGLVENPKVQPAAPQVAQEPAQTQGEEPRVTSAAPRDEDESVPSAPISQPTSPTP